MQAFASLSSSILTKSSDVPYETFKQNLTYVSQYMHLSWGCSTPMPYDLLTCKNSRFCKFNLRRILGHLEYVDAYHNET